MSRDGETDWRGDLCLRFIVFIFVVLASLVEIDNSFPYLPKF